MTGLDQQALDQAMLNNELWEATAENDLLRMEQAIRQGADIEMQHFASAATPLCAAAYRGNIEAVQYLLEAGADVNAQPVAPLAYSIDPMQQPSDTVIAMLLAAGADPALEDQWNRTAIDRALEFRFPDIVKYLQSIVDDPSRRPAPESVGLDMNKRIAALDALGKPLGQFTEAERRRTQQRQTRKAQRQAALRGEGI